MLAKGTIVEIFEDPLTMIHKEGNAKIVSHVEQLEPGVDIYRVSFVGDDPATIVERTIAKSPICCCTDPVRPDNPNCRVHGATIPAHWVGGGE